MKKILLAIFAIANLFLSCSPKPSTEFLSGSWRGEFDARGTTIPFNFLVEDDTTSLVRVYLINGKERALLDTVYYKQDSVIIPIDIYDAILIGKIKDDSISGYFRKNQIAKQGIPFKAQRNQNFRFEVSDSTSVKSVSGKWSVYLTSIRDGKSETRYNVGLLEQQGSKVTGTILTTTGDYRYLEGVVDGNTLKLSAFSGSNPLLLNASLVDSINLKGELITAGGVVALEAIRNDTAKLADPYALTYLKNNAKILSFSFPDLNGNAVSLSDEKYKGKVVIVTILGSWCPNCVDEAAFLSPWFKENKNKGVEIVGLAFERKDDINFARERLGKLIKKFDIHYDILFAGIADKANASEKLPQLNAVLSFPTTIFIDRNGRVRKIHTGYSGPATGKYYDEFIEEFNALVKTLTDEDRPV